MELYGRVRRAVLVEGRSQRSVAREFGLARVTVLTLGIFWFVLNALMLELASVVVPGFHISGFGAAFVGAIVLALVNMILRWLMPKKRSND